MSRSSITTDTVHRTRSHPGEILAEECLSPLGMSANARALSLRVPATRIGAILKGRRGVTADTALRLGRFLGGPPESWMNLQSAHDLSRARMDVGSVIEKDVSLRAA